MSILNILVGKNDCIQVAFMCSNSLYYITLLDVFICLYNYIAFILCTAHFVFVLTFPFPGLYWIYGNKDDGDDDELPQSDPSDPSLGQFNWAQSILLSIKNLF
jgi:hypothetical protein